MESINKSENKSDEKSDVKPEIIVFDYSGLDEKDRPLIDYENPMKYRLTLFTRTIKDGRLKVYTYYWESPEHNQEIYKVRTNYIEFLSYKFKDAPHFCDGTVYHRNKKIIVYDTKKERLVTRFTPVILRCTDPYTEKEHFDIDYNYFSENASKKGTKVIGD